MYVNNIYKMMRDTPSLAELSYMINEIKSEVKTALKDLGHKIDKGKMKTLVEEVIS